VGFWIRGGAGSVNKRFSTQARRRLRTITIFQKRWCLRPQRSQFLTFDLVFLRGLLVSVVKPF
jgi:hypothetical protein